MTFTKKISLNKIDVVEELAEHNITALLFMVESIENNKLAVFIAKQLSSGRICYVSLHKTAEALIEQLESKKVNTKNMVFIDGITKVLGLPAVDTDKIHFVNYPGELKELDFLISNIINHPCDYVIFDSVTDLIPYSKMGEIKEFIKNLIDKIRFRKMKGIFYTKNSQNLSSFVEEIEPLMNGTINADVI